MSYYFPHDYDALNDDKLLQVRGEFGLEGYALFWMCLETMAKNDNGHLIASLIGGLSLGYGVPKDRLVSFLNFCVSLDLFGKDEQGFFSQRMLEHKNRINLLSVSGKKGADKRWKNSHPISPPIATPLAPLMQIREDNIREDTILKDNTEIEDVTNIIAPPSAGAEKVNDTNRALSHFQMKLNPTLNYGNKTQRKAIDDLIALMGVEKLIRTIDYVVSIREDTFAPIITTPYQLKEKFAQLTAYYQKKANKPPLVASI